MAIPNSVKKSIESKVGFSLREMSNMPQVKLREYLLDSSKQDYVPRYMGKDSSKKRGHKR